MNERDFIYWLQGYLEMTNETTLNEKQVQIIKDHIKQVVIKVTPERHNSLLMPTFPHGPLGPATC